MAEDLLDYWLRIVRPVFPENAWIIGRISKGDHVIEIDWQLGSDPALPQRRSKKIEIIIQEQAIDAYLDKTKSERPLSEDNIKNWISERYMNFNPEQDPKSYRAASVDRWRLSKDIVG